MRAKSEAFGLCPLCRRWMAVKQDGTLQTHGPYGTRGVLGSAVHKAIVPKQIVSREKFLTAYIRRDYRYELEAAAQ